MSNISGKKEVIFDEAIKLISTFGFEAINLRQLAQLSEIKAASIYNHFSSKQEILDSIYEYYIEHFLDNLKPESEVKEIIESSTKSEIIKALIFTFENSDIKKYQRMALITKIIYTRIHTDKNAAKIFFDIMLKEVESYVTKLLDYGISAGRFKQFDTKTFATLLISSLHMMGIKAFNKEDYAVGQLDEEKALSDLFAELLPLNNDYQI